MTKIGKRKIGVLTSGGDAPGMNAAVRSVVRTALDLDIEVYAIYEGYQGMVDGHDYIKKMDWNSVGGILQQGGTIIGSARCDEFRTRQGRLKAALNLLHNGIDRLVVIGGDGSLTGANIFRNEWPSLIEDLVEKELISRKIANNHPVLYITGLVGSIDNDMFGTDMTIGADTALHRITDAIDAISSTAASHQRTFVVKVMGRNCGYLALMSALATGADWVLIPEYPPDVDNWEQVMCDRLIAGRKAGRRDTIVVLAEGAHDRDGKRIGSSDVARVLEEGLGEEVRVTVLGHVQRGGSPSAFDRNLGTIMGNAAVDTLLSYSSESEPQLIGIRGNKVSKSSLMECVNTTHQVAEAIKEKDYEMALKLRGTSFIESFDTLKTILRALPHEPKNGLKQHRLAVIHSGAPSPGMNASVRAAVRIGLDRGHTMLGIENGFPGFVRGQVIEMDWMYVHDWAAKGGSVLGTNRVIPESSDWYAIARTIEEFDIHGVLIIGGWPAYESAYNLINKRKDYPDQ